MLTHNPILLVAVKILDDIAVAIYTIVIVLVIADLAQDTGCFNLFLDALSVSSGIGYTFSNSVTGTIVEKHDFDYGFMFLCIFGIAGFILLCFPMPETLISKNIF